MNTGVAQTWYVCECASESILKKQDPTRKVRSAFLSAHAASRYIEITSQHTCCRQSQFKGIDKDNKKKKLTTEIAKPSPSLSYRMVVLFPVTVFSSQSVLESGL